MYASAYLNDTKIELDVGEINAMVLLGEINMIFLLITLNLCTENKSK
jgi:hypothetical protein